MSGLNKQSSCCLHDCHILKDYCVVPFSLSFKGIPVNKIYLFPWTRTRMHPSKHKDLSVSSPYCQSCLPAYRTVWQHSGGRDLEKNTEGWGQWQRGCWVSKWLHKDNNNNNVRVCVCVVCVFMHAQFCAYDRAGMFVCLREWDRAVCRSLIKAADAAGTSHRRVDHIQTLY